MKSKIAAINLAQLLFLSLVTSISSASATEQRWTVLDTGEGQSLYIDGSTISRSGTLLKLWTLMDFTDVQIESGDSYLSSIGQWEYNCLNRTSRQVFHAIYSGSMGRGKPVWSGGLKKAFQPIIPGTAGELVYLVACPK